MDTAAGMDFFVSYTGADVAWAEWIAVELERVGYTTFCQVLDIRPGQDFVHEMQRAAETAARTIAVLSPAYTRSEFGEAEWRTALTGDPSGEQSRLIPVRVQVSSPPGLLRSRVCIDLFDCAEDVARARLLDGVGPAGPRPTTAAFPGKQEERRVAGAAAFPGRTVEISNLPSRNLAFTGRDELLATLRERLREATVAEMLPVEAVHGLGGVGKTELITEFAHRYAGDFDLVWWIDAEQPTTAAAALVHLAGRLGVPVVANQEAMINTLFDLLRRRERWLLVYDNAEQPQALNGLLPPGGRGSVLVTSRWSAWGQRAARLRVDVLKRAESVQLLSQRTGLIDKDDRALLSEVAELVGDLPLALEEAAAYLEQTGTGVSDYLLLLRERSTELFGLDPNALAGSGPQADERRVATVWSVSLDRIRERAPAAEAVMELFAFLAPDIPRHLAAEHLDALPEPVAAVVSDRLAYDRVLAALGAYSLVELSAETIRVHRLVQAVVRTRLREGEAATAEVAVRLVRTAFPDDSWEYPRWSECARLLPHLLAVCEHAQRLNVAGGAAGWLLDRVSMYMRGQGLYRGALPLADFAVTITRTALGPSDAVTASRFDELARMQRELGDLAGARIHYERAAQISEAALGPDHPAVGACRNGLGNVLWALGDLRGARTQYERALHIGECALGADHPDVGTCCDNLGSVLRDLGDLTGARAQFERAVQISVCALGPDHPDVGTRCDNLGSVLRDLGDLTGARAQFERALHISESVLGPDHPDVAMRRNNLGEVLWALGDPRGARTEYEHALRISEAALGPDHPDIASWRSNLGAVLWFLGDLTGALSQYKQALHIHEAAPGTGQPPTETVRRALE